VDISQEGWKGKELYPVRTAGRSRGRGGGVNQDGTNLLRLSRRWPWRIPGFLREELKGEWLPFCGRRHRCLGLGAIKHPGYAPACL
jgi:hypothetical protein